MFGRDSSARSRRFNGLAVLFAVLGVAVIAGLWRFWPWMPHVLFGDDLANILQYQSPKFTGSWFHLVADREGNKYRPIFDMSLYALFNLFGTNLVGFQLVNVLLLALSAVFAFSVAQRLNGGRWMLSMGVAIAVAASRFALYQVTQVTGLVEGLALVFFMAMLYCVVRARAGGDTALKWGWLSILAAFLAIHTHERYIVVFPWLFGLFLFCNEFRIKSRARWLGLLAGAAVAPMLNVLYKVLVLRMPFFFGTGGQLIRPHFDQTVRQVEQAVLSLFGFNYGPEYLVGTSIASIASTSLFTASIALLLAIVLTSAWVVAFVSGTRTLAGDKDGDDQPFNRWLTWPMILICLTVLLLLPPVLTIRVEQRWLLAPFLVLLLIFVCSVNAWRERTAVGGWVLAAGVFLSSLSIDSIFSAYFPRISFVSTEAFAATVKRDVADKYPGASSPVGFFLNKPYCTWTLMNGQFFSVYGGRKRSIYCAQTIQEAEEFPADARIYDFNASGELIDITADWKAQFQPSDGRQEFDFLSAFPTGHIGNPSGGGAIKAIQHASWDSVTGLQDTLTITDGYSYRYDSVHIGNDAQLRFAMSAINPTSGTVIATVSVQKQNAPVANVVFQENLVPRGEGVNLTFAPVSVSLKPYYGQDVSITFEVGAPSAKSLSPQQVAFAWPRIVLAPAH